MEGPADAATPGRVKCRAERRRGGVAPGLALVSAHLDYLLGDERLQE